MQLNLNTQNHNPQFGMAININSSNFSRILSERVKNGNDIIRLERIFERANKNDIVDIYLGTNENGRLWANLAERRVNKTAEKLNFQQDLTPYADSFHEGLFSRLFKNPVNTIEDLVIKAEHKAEEIKSSRKLFEAVQKALSEK